MMDINVVIVTGTLTKDIEIAQAKSGKIYTRFQILSERPTTHGNKKKTYINCTAWENIAQALASDGKKDVHLGVVGRVESGQYTNSKGRKIYTQAVVAEKYFIAAIPEGMDMEESAAQILGLDEKYSDYLAEAEVDAQIDAQDLPF